MAKNKGTDAPQGVEPAPGEVGAWNPEDVNLLSTELERVAGVVNELREQNDELHRRLATAESHIQILDPSRAAIPADVVAEVSLADIYKTALSGAIIARFASQPHLTRQASTRDAAMADCLDLAETAMRLAADRFGSRT